MESVRFFKWRIMPSANRNNLTSLFPICPPFCLVLFLKLSIKPMLSMSRKSEYTCFILNFRRNILFSPFNIMFTIGLSNIALIMMVYAPSVPNLFRIFLIKEY